MRPAPTENPEDFEGALRAEISRARPLLRKYEDARDRTMFKSLMSDLQMAEAALANGSNASRLHFWKALYVYE